METRFDTFKTEELMHPQKPVGISIDYGCNGSQHAVWKDKLYYLKLENGERQVEFAETITVQVIGRCDGSCKNHPYLGGFIHPS